MIISRQVLLPRLALCWSLLSPLLAHAAPATPGAGSILQQMQPNLPGSPLPAETGLSIEQENGARLPPSEPFLVSSFQIMGNECIDSATLNALLADAQGKTLTLPQIEELTARITNYYHDHGYPLARALIPAQAIRAGLLRIVVIEARYGNIAINNASRVQDGLLQATVAPLQGGEVITQKALSRSMLLLSDIPGVRVSGAMKPGASVGTSDLAVEVESATIANGNLAMDDYGNRYTRRLRVGATLDLMEPLQHGDVLSLNALSSGDGLHYGRAHYETLLNGQGSRLGVSVSALDYKLVTGPAISIHAHGNAEVASVWAKHPVLRSQEANVTAQLEFEHKQLRDHVDVGTIRTDRHLDNWSLGLSGDERDRLWLAAVNSWSLTWTSGHVSFDDPAAQSVDAATARTRGTFAKWNFNLARLQELGPSNLLQLSLAGQWAMDNLDASEKMVAGGPYTVRGYDMGALSGDGGLLASAELRHVLGSAWHGQWQIVAFVDSERIWLNRNSWAVGTNAATLSGAGAGISWAGSGWSARLYVATPVGATPAMVTNTAFMRAWAEIIKTF